MSFHEYEQRLAQLRVPTWHLPGEHEVLYSLVTGLGTGTRVIDIGTFCGVTAGLFAAAGADVLTVDNDTPELTIGAAQLPQLLGKPSESAQFLWRELGLSAQIRAIIGDAGNPRLARGATCQLLFIDSDHGPEVGKHIDAWSGAVRSGGYLAFHDWGLPGPNGTWCVKEVATDKIGHLAREVIRVQSLSVWKVVY